MDQWNHGTTEYTQTNWNGIVGDISIQAKEKVHIRRVNVYPDIENKSVLAKVELSSLTTFQKGIIRVACP